MHSLAAFVFLFLARRSLDAAQCDAFSGPPGTTECVKFSDYYRHQWATCITDAYIRQKSRHKHTCSDKSSTYCWYQCMLEVRGKSSGPVTEDCYCNPPALTTVSPTLLPATTLSPACYSPSGGDCDWFSDCLERKYLFFFFSRNDIFISISMYGNIYITLRIYITKHYSITIHCLNI